MPEAAPAVPSDELLEWPKKDKRRFLHAVYRVGERTIKFALSLRFYTECFGMKLLRQRDIPDKKYSNAFLGFVPEDSNFVVELTYSLQMVEDIRAKGGNITREPGPVKGGKSVIDFVKDPDGYTFELIQRPPTLEPLCQVMLCVGDLERSIKFYEMALSTEILFLCRLLVLNPYKAAFIEPNSSQTLTFSQFKSTVAKLSHSFINQLGIKKNDIVLICIPCPKLNSIPICFLLATIAIGTNATTLKPAYTVSKISKQVEDCKPKVIVTVSDLWDKVKRFGLKYVMISGGKNLT
ncbi:hypothetical protein Vadar_031513 [Vaccinium darrowii]|uniref:Uncharacterized protein n=1 Tax=Vaccinium darrowii TaxID=229202 RepID=A0ACB7Z0I1_9ERIC|nr:hypothetical protein Vadar_031513 [Vaccinium darrowii]